MSEMVDRVAAAIRKKCAEIEHRKDVLDADPMSFSLEYARAAIEAMREPTKGMLDAVYKQEDVRGYVHTAFETMGAEDSWPVMIDAALKEGQ